MWDKCISPHFYITINYHFTTNYRIGFYSCVVTKQMNGNSYYITTSFIPCNIDSYYSVITITVYQTCPKLSLNLGLSTRKLDSTPRQEQSLDQRLKGQRFLGALREILLQNIVHVVFLSLLSKKKKKKT